MQLKSNHFVSKFHAINSMDSKALYEVGILSP